MMWHIEREEGYFKIFDNNKNIAAYFDPEYGDIFPEDKVDKIIEEMHKNHEKILGGYLMVPLVKFGIFSEEEMQIENLHSKVEDAKTRIERWYNFISDRQDKAHSIRVSHTDSDMLSITFPIRFSEPTPLEKKLVLEQLEITLSSLNASGLI